MTGEVFSAAGAEVEAAVEEAAVVSGFELSAGASLFPQEARVNADKSSIAYRFFFIVSPLVVFSDKPLSHDAAAFYFELVVELGKFGV